jgi:uncharacterized protein with GYD domain
MARRRPVESGRRASSTLRQALLIDLSADILDALLGDDDGQDARVVGRHIQAEGAKGVLKEGGTGRREATEKLVGSLGGTVEAYYFAFGADDFFLITDLPGNAAAAAGALTGAASGAIGTRTIVLLTPEEVDAATKLSPSYRPPGK